MAQRGNLPLYTRKPEAGFERAAYLANLGCGPCITRCSGVADINVFGGQDKVYELSIDPVKLEKYSLTPLQVYDAVTKSNLNVGGDVIEKSGQSYVVRELVL